MRGEIAALPLEGVIDLVAERARLTKEIHKLDADMPKIDAKLGNADFLKRAPEEVVEEQRERREEALGRKAKMEEALERSAWPRGACDAGCAGAPASCGRSRQPEAD